MAAGGLFAAAAVVAPAANATTFTVDSLADNGDGSCQGVPFAGDGFCTLRDATRAANANANSPATTPDVIEFAANVRGTIQLAGDSLKITDDGVDVRGPGADQLTVVAPQVQGEGVDRIFKIFGFVAQDEQVTISGLTLRGGRADDFPETGGAILSTDVGGSCNDSAVLAALTLRGLHITGNHAGWDGGGVAVDPTYSCDDKAGAAGAASGDLNVVNSTVSGNHANESGGGIAMTPGSGSLFVSNSTVVGNDSDYSGGGISIDQRRAGKITAVVSAHDVDNSTIAGNTTGADEGGGIYTSVPLGIRSTIVQGNSATESDQVTKATFAADIASGDAPVSSGYSLIGTRAGANIIDIAGEPNLSGDPQLGALGANGGPTPTRAPATTSPVIDTGIANGLGTDQRGVARTVDRPPANAADGTDIGAVELPVDPVTPTPDPDPTPTPIPGPSTELCLGKQVILTKGTDADETISGTGVDDGILSGGGVDKIEGLGGDDCLFGQIGNDLVIGGPGNDNANGDRDNDTVKGNDGVDSVRGQNGNDKVFGGAGDDPKVTGGAGDDKVFGGPGDDMLKGDGGNDFLKLGSGKDFVHSGGGADKIKAADGEKDRIICGTGKDIATVDSIDNVDEDCNTVKVVD